MSATLDLSVQAVANSTNIQKNTSDIHIVLTISSSGTYSQDGTTRGYIRIDGTQVASLNGKWIYNNTTTTLYDARHTIAHNANGKKTVTVQAYFSPETPGTAGMTKTLSRTVKLPDIPRASTVSGAVLTLGQPGTLRIEAADESFTHTLRYAMGTAEGVIAEKTAERTVSWTPPESLATQLPNASSGSCTITLETYGADEVKIGENTAQLSVKVPDTMAPVISAVETAWEGGLSGAAVQGKTRMQYTVSAAGQHGAAITGCAVSFGGVSAAGLSGTTPLLHTAGDFALRVTVTDSRGMTTEKVGTTQTVYAYGPPAITQSQAIRSDSSGAADSEGAYAAVKLKAEVSPVGERNSASLRVRYRAAGGAWSGYTALTDGEVTVLPGFLPTASYEVELSALDTVGEGRTVVYTVPTAAVAFHLRQGGKGAAFGQYSQKASYVESVWPLDMNGCRIEQLGEPEAEDDAATRKYVDEAIRSALLAAHPVGSVYLSLDAADPSALFGGTWVRIEDTFLLAAGTTAAGATGGEATHTLTETELPKLYGELYNVASQSSSNNVSGTGVFSTGGSEGHGYAVNSKTDKDVIYFNVGGGEAHNNMPPYLAVYMWKRTA